VNTLKNIEDPERHVFDQQAGKTALQRSVIMAERQADARILESV